MESYVKKQCLRGQRLELPGEARSLKAVTVFCVSVCALAAFTVAAAIYKAVR